MHKYASQHTPGESFQVIPQELLVKARLDAAGFVAVLGPEAAELLNICEESWS